MASAGTGRAYSVEAALADADRQTAAGRPAAALQALADAMRVRLVGDDRVARLAAADLYLIERMADLSIQLGQWAAADDLLAAMALASDEAGNVEGADYALLKQAHLMVLRTATIEAMEILARMESRMGALADIEISPAGLGAWERGCGWNALGAAAAQMLISRAYCVMAALLLEFGRFADAMTVIDRAIDRLADPWSGHGARLALPVLQLMRANAALEAGEPEKASASIAAIEESGASAASTQAILALEVAGRAALVTGAFGEALDAFGRIASMADELGLQRSATSARLDRCRILISLNQTVRAEDELVALGSPVDLLADPALAQRRAELLELVGLRRSSAASEIDLGTSATAMQGGRSVPRDRGAAWSATVSPPFGGFSARFSQAAATVEQALALGETRDAQEALEEARVRAGRTDSGLIRGHLALLEGLTLNKAHDNHSGVPKLREAIQLLRRAKAGPLLWQALRALARALEDGAGDERAAIEDEAERLLETLLASLGAPEDRAIYRLNKSSAEDERLLGAIAELSAQKLEMLAGWGPFRWLAGWRLNRRLARFCMELDLGQGTAPSSGRWMQAIRRTTRHEPTVVYLLLPDVIAIILIRRGRFDLATVATSRLSVQDKLGRWHAHVRKAFETGANAAGGVARGYMEMLAADLRLPEILGSGGKTLRIVPHGVLHAFPFAACEWDGRSLVERCAIALAPTIAPARGRRGSVSSGLVAVAESVAGEPRLDEAVKEGFEVAAILREASVKCAFLSGPAAGLGDVARALSQVQLAHFACHGRFIPDQPERTGLVFDDDLLTLGTIEGMDLSRLEQVTLSACSAADTFVLPGRVALSLPTMLLAAGAGGVLAALWPIEDSVARAFVTRFYRHCRRHDRAEALRRTQQECIAGFPECDFETSSPYYWAGFLQVGGHSRLRLGPGSLNGLFRW